MPARHRRETARRPGSAAGASRWPRIPSELRGDVQRRPVVDPGLAGGLRAWLEDGIFAAVATSERVSGPVITAGPLGVGDRDPGRAAAVTSSVAARAVLHAVFRQLVMTGSLGSPMADALDALRIDDRLRPVAQFVDRLPPSERLRLEAEIAEQARLMRQRWRPGLSPAWLPRTRERIWVPLAGGRIRLTAVADLLLGTPSAGRSSICLVRVVPGRRQPWHREQLHFTALLETLRSGAPPFRAALYYTPTGELDAEDVTEGMLAASVRRTIEAAVQACERQHVPHRSAA